MFFLFCCIHFVFLNFRLCREAWPGDSRGQAATSHLAAFLEDTMRQGQYSRRPYKFYKTETVLPYIPKLPYVMTPHPPAHFI